MAPNSQRRTILVTDGEQRASLAVVRSLGAAGHLVHVCATIPRSLAGGSRFASSEHVVASSLDDAGRFVENVRTLVAQKGIDTIIPMTEPALLALLPERARFPGVLIPFVDAETFNGIANKEAVLEAAARVGIAVPAQSVLVDSQSAQATDTAALKYPLVVKPARSVSGGAGDRLKLSVEHAASERELLAILDAIDPRAYPLLLQQRVMGPGVGVFVLIWNGELIAQFAHRRIREKPPSGGVSVYRSSIPVDQELLRVSLALLAEFSWQGVAMVEYKLDAADGTPYLMEINGRFWGSLQLAIDAGVDFPRLLIDVASGGSPEHVDRFRTDVRSRWFWGDVDHLLARLRKSKTKLSLPDDASSRWRAFGDFLVRHPNDVSEVHRRGDGRPFLRESLQWFKQLGR
ncbi:MAG: ATP-grasp domain-containing protein [Gemmatimonadaceae bacterium]